jgi:hypothetical protein
MCGYVAILKLRPKVSGFMRGDSLGSSRRDIRQPREILELIYVLNRACK